MTQTLTFAQWFAKAKLILVSKYEWDAEDIMASIDSLEDYYNAGYTVVDAITDDRTYWN